MADNKETINFQEFEEEFEDTLSFSDLPIHDQDEQLSISLLGNPSSDHSSQDLFEFSTGLRFDTDTNRDVFFCGKIIPVDDERNLRSSSFRNSPKITSDDSERNRKKCRSYSLRLPKSDSRSIRASDRCGGSEKMNITSMTTMSAKSRRRMCVLGPLRFEPEMELSDIKKRQRRLRGAPAPMFPAVSGGGEAVVSSGGGKGGYLGMVLIRTLRCKSHLAAVLAKSFGCISSQLE